MKIHSYKGVPLPVIAGYHWTNWDEASDGKARICTDRPVFSGSTTITHRGWIEYDCRRHPEKYRVVARRTDTYNDMSDLKHIENTVDTPEEAVALLSGWILMGMPE